MFLDREEAATATHYEILGVAPNAGHDEVKRAFLDHALRFHPDRQADQSPAARERAEFRMREINSAWEVLRNPAARARYDDELKAAAATAREPVTVRSSAVFDTTGAEQAAPPSPVRARPKVISLEPDDVADLAPADSPEPTAARVPRWFVWGPIIVGGTMIVAILIAAAAGSRPGSTVKLNTVEQFAAGTCVAVIDPASAGNADGQPALISLPCSSAHNGRVVALQAASKPCPQGSKAFLDPDDHDKSVCVVAE